MILSNDYANQYLNFLMGQVASISAPTKIWIGLSSTDPEVDGGSFTELSGGNYRRILIKNRGESYPDVLGTASGRIITNTKQINWDKASEAWADSLGIGLFSAETGGTPFAYGRLAKTLEVPQGAVALLEPGMMEIYMPSFTEAQNAE